MAKPTNASPDAIVVQKAYDLQLWTMERVSRFPRNNRYGLGEKLTETCLELLLSLVDAAFAPEKRAALAQAVRGVNRMRYLVRLCKDVRLVTATAAGQAVEMVDEIGRMAGGWLKSVDGRSLTLAAR